MAAAEGVDFMGAAVNGGDNSPTAKSGDSVNSKRGIAVCNTGWRAPFRISGLHYAAGARPRASRWL